MKELVMKDIRLIGTSNIFILAMGIFGGSFGMFTDDAFSSNYFYGIAMIGSWFLVNTLIAKKESQLKSDALIMSLPVRKFDIIKAKYITMLIYIFGTLAVIYLVSNIVNILSSNAGGSPLGLSGILIIASIMIILKSFYIPFQYYDYKTAQFVPAIMQVLVIGTPNVIEGFDLDFGSTDFIEKIFIMDFQTIGFVFIGASLILYAMSTFVSKGIYEAKEF